MKILILTAGKTGSTALTYAIKERLPNHKIVFEPPDLARICRHDNLIVKSLKIAGWKREEREFINFQKKILLIRHPYDRIISYLLYIPCRGAGFSNDYLARRYINLIREKTESPSAIDISEIVALLQQIQSMNVISLISREHSQMLEIFSRGNRHQFELVKYEDFVDGNNEKINEYLGFELASGANVEVDQKWQRVSRKRNYGDWKSWFTEKDIDRLSEIFGNFNKTFGYRSHRQVEDAFAPIEPEFSYLYTIKVINNYRENNCLPLYEDGKIRLGREGIHVDQAIAFLRGKEYEKAEDAINRALSINPGSPEVHLLRAKILEAKSLGSVRGT